MNNVKVYLSPSDQWSNTVAGAKHSEAFHCFKIADYARIYLELNGYEVKVGESVTENTYKNRVIESNKWGSDLHIPIHTNAGGGEGTLMLCYPTRTSNKYVNSIYTEVANLTPTEDRGIQASKNLYEITATKGLTAYLECEFHDNVVTENWIDNHVKELGMAIARGVCKADGKSFVSETKKETKYRVQVGAFENRANAEKMRTELKDKGYEAFIVEVL